MRLYLSILAALGAGFFLTGCASIGAHSEGPTSRLYPGVRGDAHCIAHPKEAEHPVLNAVDLPFSFVGDTLFLPCDVIACVLDSRSKRKKTDE